MVPRGTTLNSNPTATATATPGSGNWTNISQGGPVAVRDNTINTPDSSRGTPAVQWLRPLHGFSRQARNRVGAPNTVHAEFQHWGAAAGDSQRANGAGTHADRAGALWQGGLARWAQAVHGDLAPTSWAQIDREAQPTNQGEDAVLKRHFQPAPIQRSVRRRRRSANAACHHASGQGSCPKREAFRRRLLQ